MWLLMAGENAAGAGITYSRFRSPWPTNFLPSFKAAWGGYSLRKETLRG
jgi:hypothetical protein